MWMYFLLSWKILLLKFRYPGVQHFNELQPPPPPGRGQVAEFEISPRRRAMTGGCDGGSNSGFCEAE